VNEEIILMATSLFIALSADSPNFLIFSANLPTPVNYVLKLASITSASLTLYTLD